ncbi:MAG: hypothetical protein KC503_39800 [Myxococcales bacterium]|nr:hypothetical protein [Myxococcales bacterium]
MRPPLVLAIVVAAASVLVSPPRARAGGPTYAGATPLRRGQLSLRLSGGLVAFVPRTVAGLTPLAEGFVPLLPEGQVALGVGFSRADVFAYYATIGGLIQHLGAEGRFAFLRLRRVSAALATRFEYQLRAVAADSLAFAGTLRLAPDLRLELCFGSTAVFARWGVTVELVHSDYQDRRWQHDTRAFLSTYDVGAGVEWRWGADARFFIMARAEIAAQPAIVIDPAWIGLTAGGGFDL